MSSISSIIADLTFSRSQLLRSIEGLSERELTETPIYHDSWTIKDVLAHIIGWDQRTLEILPLILQDRAGEVAGVEVEAHNRHSVEAWRDKSFGEVLSTIRAIHSQILDIIASLDHVKIDLRHERRGRVVTIRSYIIDVMTAHDLQHAAEIQRWRKELEQAIDPETIKQVLAENRAKFLAALAGFSEADLLDKSAVGVWSVKDVVGHVADWEERMLVAARHIYDPSLPAAPSIGPDTDERNAMMAANREAESWQKTSQSLRNVQAALDEFVNKLTAGDWKLRGLYPWPDDQGTLAQLISEVADHYGDHIPDLEAWRQRKNL